MPRFYGDSMNIVPRDGQSLEDAMVIKNTSIDSNDVDFCYFCLSQEGREIVDFAMAELEDNDL